jgi:myo-inositol-1(or 4)-monophosphatase
MIASAQTGRRQSDHFARTDAMTADDEQELLRVAEAAADAAAAELRARYGTSVRGVQTKSTPTDLVSEADVSAERAIRRVLAEQRPGDGILGEEGGATEGTSAGGDGAVRWIVDPLDGTINYLYGIPAFAVSVACEDAAGTIAGIVLDPVREERFAATRSGPPTLNGEPITAGSVTDLSMAMVATGFGYDAAVRARQADILVRVLPRVRDIRRVGAAALDLVWCACGRFDAYYERGVHSWDIAAGALVAERAGLVVRELEETEADPFGLVAAPAAFMDELHALASGQA